MPNDKDAPAPTPAPQVDGAAKKKHHRLRWLIIVLAVIGLLVFAAPYIVASRPVLGWILSSVNGRIRGQIEVDELSLGWFSPPSVRGLRVLDADRRPVLSVAGIRAGKSLLALAAGPMDFGQIDVDDPNVILYQMPDGQYSLDDAFSPPGEPKPDKPAGELPRPRGTIIISRGTVTVVDLTGRRLTLTEANTNVDIQTLDHLVGSQSVQFPNGEVLKTKYALTGLVQDGKFQPGGIDGTLKVWTDKPIDLAPLGKFAMPEKGLAGTLGIDANVTLYHGKPDGGFTVSLADLKADGGYTAKVKPVSFSVTATAAMKDKKVAGTLGLHGKLGRIDGTYTYQPGPMPELTAAKLISAVLTGDLPAIPEMALDANGQVDLEALANAVPSLLQLRHDVIVTAGTMKLTSLTVRGGLAPTVGFATSLDGVHAVQTKQDGRQQPVELEPISMDFDSAIVGGMGLNVRLLELKSAFASLDGSGTPKDFHARYNADLAAAIGEIGKIIDLKQLALTGKLDGTMDVAMAGDERLNYSIDAKAGGLSVADGNQPPLTLRAATLSSKGRLDHKAGKDVKVAAEMFTLDVDDSLSITGRASMDTATGTLDVNAVVQRADLAGLWAKASAMGVKKPASLAGMLTGQMDASRKSSADPIAANASFTVRQLRIDGKPVSEKDIRLVLDGLSVLGPKVLIAARNISFTSDAAALTIAGLEVRTGKELALAGDLKASADLARVAAIANAFADPNSKPMELAGQLSYSGKAQKSGAEIALTGGGGITGFQTGSGKNAVKVEPLTFKQDIRIDPDKHEIRILAASMNSDMLDVTASGTIGKYGTDNLLDIRGHYKGQWDKIMAVAHELAPSTADVAITGPLDSDFVLTGPAARPTLMPVYRDVQAKAGLGWKTARILGFDLGDANVPITFEDGRVVVPATQISATGGKVNIAATVDMSKPEPQLTMPGKLVVLDNIQINREVGQKVLSRLNPIFGKLLSLEGRITLVTQDIDVPLGEALKERGTGSGHVDLTQLQFEPDGMMAELLKLGGLGGKQLVQVGGIDFVIRDGALRYDNFSMTFGGSFDLRFRGVVRFDDSIDMVVSVPVRAELLKKLGVGGSAEQYAKLLDGTRIDLPILGTREKPNLDMAKVDIQPLLKKAAEKMIGKEAGGLFDGLLKGKKPGQPVPAPQPGPQPDQPKGTSPKLAPAEQDRPGPAAQKAPLKPEDMLIRGIFDALDSAGKGKDKGKK